MAESARSDEVSLRFELIIPVLFNAPATVKVSDSDAVINIVHAGTRLSLSGPIVDPRGELQQRIPRCSLQSD